MYFFKFTWHGSKYSVFTDKQEAEDALHLLRKVYPKTEMEKCVSVKFGIQNIQGYLLTSKGFVGPDEKILWFTDERVANKIASALSASERSFFEVYALENWEVSD